MANETINPRTIYHVLNYVPLGTRTMDEFLLKFVRRIREHGWHAKFAFAGEPSLEFQKQLRDLDTTYDVLDFPLSWKATWRLARDLRRHRPAVLITSFISAFTLRILSLKLMGAARRLVVIDHSSGIASPKIGLRKLLARLRGWAAGRLLDRVLPVSDANARREINDVYLPAEKVQRIYNGISLERFRPAEHRAAGPLRIAYVGQLTKEKGILTLLRALSRLPGEFELTIAGKGPQEAELKEFCRVSLPGRVRFAGHIATVSELFSASDVVVVPSEWQEAFGLVAAEAMACGATLIVSDAGGLPEVVGDAGLVFRRGDDVDLEDKLRQLLDSPSLCAELGKRGRRRVEVMFTLDRCVEERLAAVNALPV